MCVGVGVMVGVSLGRGVPEDWAIWAASVRYRLAGVWLPITSVGAVALGNRPGARVTVGVGNPLKTVAVGTAGLGVLPAG